jgi:hypothetical protein
MTSNNLLNINTSAKLGHFGNEMLKYGECRIGSIFWERNELTLEDKERFESYQNACWLGELKDMSRYENATPPAMRDKIINTIVEIKHWYGINSKEGGDKEEEEEEEEE